MVELRAELMQDVSNRGAERYRRIIIANGGHPLVSTKDPAKAGLAMADAEYQRLSMSELYHVSADMVDLAVIAERSLPGFRFVPEDLPSHFGFLYFDKPIEWDIDSSSEAVVRRSSVVAVSWGILGKAPQVDVHPGADVWISWYADAHEFFYREFNAGRFPGVSAREAELARLGPRLELAHETTMWFGDTIEAEEYEQVRSNSTTIELLGILKTVWLLMGQSLASAEQAKYDRPSLRRLKRASREPAPVRVITLRRQPADTGSHDSDREYHHQWVVRGHWRKQWYPSVNDHRPVWIAPHIKGPEGAPLLGGERVYSLKR
jgi:hypothetical protein